MAKEMLRELIDNICIFSIQHLGYLIMLIALGNPLPRELESSIREALTDTHWSTYRIV